MKDILAIKVMVKSFIFNVWVNPDQIIVLQKLRQIVILYFFIANYRFN